MSANLVQPPSRRPPRHIDSKTPQRSEQSSRITSTTSVNKSSIATPSTQDRTLSGTLHLAKKVGGSSKPSARTDRDLRDATSAAAAIATKASLPSQRDLAVLSSKGSSTRFFTRATTRSGGLPPQSTPSNLSPTHGSSTTTYQAPRSASLRRKPSIIESYAAAKRNAVQATEARERATPEVKFSRNDTSMDSALEVYMPKTTAGKAKSAPMRNDPEPMALGTIKKPNGPNEPIQYVPLAYAPSATPSTRYTDSPFSHNLSPSSVSSYSPATIAPSSKATSRLPPQSPVRSRSAPSPLSGDHDPAPCEQPLVRKPSTSQNLARSPPLSRSSATARIKEQAVASVSTAEQVEVCRPSSRGKLVKSPPKRKPSTSIKTAPAKPPPELAHLNVDNAAALRHQKFPPPTRPSRDGTPTLGPIDGASQVVWSDLPQHFTAYHKRSSSQDLDSIGSSPSADVRHRFGLRSKTSSHRSSSPRADSAISPGPMAQTPELVSSTAESKPRQTESLVRKDSPAIGPSPIPVKTSRFNLFHRRHKEDNKPPVEKPKRLATKGPAAGTGHEGYGKFNSARGRPGSFASSSASSLASRSLSGDSDSSSLSVGKDGPTKRSIGRVKDQESSGMDDFLRQRLKPVVLRGKGSSDTAGAESNIPRAVVPKPLSGFTISSQHGTKSAAPSVAANPTLPQASRPAMRTMRLPSDSSDDDAAGRFAKLEGGRSLASISQGGTISLKPIPGPVMTRNAPSDTSLDISVTEISTRGQTKSAIPRAGHLVDSSESLWFQPWRARRHEMRHSPDRRVNFLQRAHSAFPDDTDSMAFTDDNIAPDEFAPQRPYRSGALHAMMDSVEDVRLDEVERMLYDTTSAEDSMSESNGGSRQAWRHLKSAKMQQTQRQHGLTEPRHASPPHVAVRLDSAESPELLRAQLAVTQQPAHIVDIPRSPTNPAEAVQSGPFAQYDDLDPPGHLSEAKLTPTFPDEFRESSSPRAPRLSPIGRIPKVVSKRDRERKLSDHSFSRPFAKSQPKPSVKPPGSLYNQIRELASPTESGSQAVSSASTRSDGATGEGKTNLNEGQNSLAGRTSMNVPAHSEYLYMPRKDSDVSFTSSSGTNTLMAVLGPPPFQPEDIWNEYDDLLDEVMPHATHVSASSSLGAPFQYSSMLFDPTSPWMQQPQDTSPAIPTSQSVQDSSVRSSGNELSVPQQIARFMQPSLSPLSTTHSSSGLMDHYGNRSSSTLFSQIPASGHIANRASSAYIGQLGVIDDCSSVATGSHYSRGSMHSRSASLPEANARQSQSSKHSRSSLTPSARFRRDTQLLDIAEVDVDSQTSMAGLRFGALMTSKWLSFGRVLFSPAHNQMRLADEPRVLVLDGMGSDWSWYLALSYPAATVYNLGPVPANGGTTWPGVDLEPPKNHRHIGHKSIDSGFPFPKGFFTAVVFRFPGATTDDAYHASLFECKRVLMPGGHLEVAVLDLDLMNMGSQARQAVRGLKTRLQQSNGQVSLRNLSDALVRLIGRRGFEDIQRCIVGVPAAGQIPRSRGGSSASSRDSGGIKSTRPRTHRRSHGGEDTDFSFADLLDDVRANQQDGGDDASLTRRRDESITTMVAKVGRWWYSTCYEKALLATDRSIWNDPALLRECEEQGTSFRLLVCCAQKPAQTRRRTLSV